MRTSIVFGISLLIAITCFSQAKIRKLPQSINRPNINLYAPFISLDGNGLLYVSDYSEDGSLLIYYTSKEGADWKEPVPMPRHVNTKLNFTKGYTLSPDGKILYLSAFKSGGVGGYDIWWSTIKSYSWNDFQNIYAPINTKLHEASPTFTPDGTTVYFMRCEKMDQEKADNCKIFVSKKAPGGQWSEPVELPAHINTGNSQTPRIMADAETLIFASNRMPSSKGGMDLYVTKLKNGTWSNPVPLDFANTEKDDQFVSAIATGRYLLKDAPGKFKSELVEFLIPDELRPRGVMRIDGVVVDVTGTPTPAYVSITDVTTNQRVFSGRPGKDGTYFCYLTEDDMYELSIDHEQSIYTYYSKRFDLTNDAPLLNQKIKTVLKPLAAGDVIDLDAITFKKYSSELENNPNEFRRLTRLIKNSPQFSFELQVSLSGYEEDSVQFNPDLTEVRMDSIVMEQERTDSLGQVYTFDSLFVVPTYHNDRTKKQAEAIVSQLVTMGIDRSGLSYVVDAKPEAVLENRKTVIKLVAKAK